MFENAEKAKIKRENEKQTMKDKREEKRNVSLCTAWYKERRPSVLRTVEKERSSRWSSKREIRNEREKPLHNVLSHFLLFKPSE
jgi:hypothetical protein